MSPYVAIVIVIAAAFLVACLFIFGFSALAALGRRLRPYDQPTPNKALPFECGNEPVPTERRRFTVKFYVVALLFVLFDVEAIFLYPWSVLYRQLGVFGFVEMAVFLGILIVGLIYVWRKGALVWS